MSDDTLIRFENLHVNFHRWGQSLPALIDINLDVAAGQWLMIVGHNGSGKSTLLKALMGQQELSRGRVEILGQNAVGDGQGRFSSRFFHVSQDPLLGTAEGLTLWENLVVADPCPRHGWWFSMAPATQYGELLSQFDLTSRANQILRYFSGGERQQIALLIAKLRNPQILLLDEPFAALDPARIRQCEQLIASMNSAGCTVLHVTHDMNSASSLGHRTVELERGRILRDLVGPTGKA